MAATEVAIVRLSALPEAEFRVRLANLVRLAPAAT